LIRQKSPTLAALTAKYLIVDSRPSQSAYILVDHFAHSDPLVERFERWARRRLTEGFRWTMPRRQLEPAKERWRAACKRFWAGRHFLLSGITCGARGASAEDNGGKCG